VFRAALGPTQSLMQWVPATLQVSVLEVDHSYMFIAECVELYVCSPIRLLGMGIKQKGNIICPDLKFLRR
jgi:hypothetical protein